MRHRRSRRRGDWARRLTANMDPLSSDSDIFPCDSSCSSDSFSSHDNYLPRRPHLPLSEISIPISPPPPLDIRDVAFAEYAAAELPDLAIFFRNIIPPFTHPPYPYSHRISSLSNSFSDLSITIPRSPRSPRPPRDLPKSAALPPAFPDSARRPLSARSFIQRRQSFPDNQTDNRLSPGPLSRSPVSNNHSQTPPTSPPMLQRSRSAPIHPPAFPSQSESPRRANSMRHRSSSRQTPSNREKNRTHHKSSLRRKSSLPRQSVLVPSGQLSNSSSRPIPPKRSFPGSPKVLTTRRYPEDLELSAQTAVTSSPIRAVDPDSLRHFFLIEKIYRWYSEVILLTGEKVVRRPMR